MLSKCEYCGWSVCGISKFRLKKSNSETTYHLEVQDFCNFINLYLAIQIIIVYNSVLTELCHV